MESLTTAACRRSSSTATSPVFTPLATTSIVSPKAGTMVKATSSV
jgi:hypothetical protein